MITILQGDARHLPLPDASVDLVVTSPPFLNLRSYQDGGQHYDGQIGAGTRDQFLEDLWEVTAECARILKPTGSMFVELGDSYTSKSLNLSPQRYAIGCVDKLGLLLRAEIIWSRPNGLPESVTDRVRRSHSVWFHLTRQPRYFAAVDAIREAHAQRTIDQAAIDARSSRQLPRAATGHAKWSEPGKDGRIPPFTPPPNPLGKLPGSVWTIATQPLTVPGHLGVDHFAAFPMEWPRRIVQGWSPPGGRVVDPFGGTGTVALVAHALGRHGISNDMSADYCRLARWRTTDPGQLAAAMQVEKPAVQHAGQSSLLDLLTVGTEGDAA